MNEIFCSFILKLTLLLVIFILISLFVGLNNGYRFKTNVDHSTERFD